LFAERPADAPKALIITGANPPAEAVDRIGDLAEWQHLDTDRPTPAGILGALDDRGADVVLVEGGPSFNGQMVDAGLLDELCLTISPHLVGGASPRIVDRSTSAIPADLRLERVLEHDHALFLRYVRA
jgi:riboflavin biosynthesis pyrimidine reductase